jgi:hypothetical protein
MLRIGVELLAGAGSGELLADVRAYEAAGADLVWLARATDGTDGPPGFEPLTLLAAAAAVTSRVRLAASMAVASPWPPALAAHAVATLHALSGGRVAVGLEAAGRDPGAPPADRVAGVLRAAGASILVCGRHPDEELLALAARLGDGLVLDLGLGLGLGVSSGQGLALDTAASAAADEASAAFARVVELRSGAGVDAAFECWSRVPAPAGRPQWREVLDAHGSTGATGLIVAHAPNLLDILRNPEEDDRQDLSMAIG